MGMAGTRFGRNVPLEDTWPDRDKILDPNPREISRRLMTRDKLIPASAGNALDRRLAAVHAARLGQARDEPDRQPVGHPARAGRRLAEPPLQVMRTPDDPTAPAESDTPPTHINVKTHWWDGSQIYGNSPPEQNFLRSHEGGKLRLVDGLPPMPDDPATNPTRRTRVLARHGHDADALRA